MKRWLGFFGCTALGLTLLVCGLLVPAHLRAVDAHVLKRAGKKTRSVVQEGSALLEQKQLGPARQLALAATAENLREHGQLEQNVEGFAKLYPRLQVWGAEDFYLDRLFQVASPSTNSVSHAFTPFIVQSDHRERLLEFLGSSSLPEVKALLQCRTLTNTSVFSPSQSASGQAWDTALALAGLLVHEHRLKPGLQEAIGTMAGSAARGADSGRFEQALLDLVSLGQRFDWAQLGVLLSQVEDAEALRQLAQVARKAELYLPVLFSAVELSGNPSGVANYLMQFSRSGWKDLALTLHFGAGGLKELLSRRQPVYSSSLRDDVVGYDPFATFFYASLDYCWTTPWVALSLKWCFYLAGGFLIAMAWHFARPPVPALELPLQVPGFHLARELLFALGFLLVLLLLSEPFLAQESQKVDLPFRLRLPMVGANVAAGTTVAPASFMNPISLLTMLLFFVLQGLIYVACLVKLAEIRRQGVHSRIKLRLLENEDHLFDAGLYLGFVGTIISLILVSLGVIKQPSLMAAYSSTSFGIIFVSIFKIFHLRPLRRKLVLESEAIPS